MAIQVSRRLFTVAEYHRMAEAGILGEDDRVELIEGEIVWMSPIGRRHAAGVYRLTDMFSERYRDAALLGVQNPVLLSEHSEPQPDIALLRRSADFYASAEPTPADVLLLVEVADTSADYDRRVKALLYARADIAELWLVDLEADAILLHREPSPGGYRLVRTVRRGESLSPLAFPDRPLVADDILG